MNSINISAKFSLEKSLGTLNKNNSNLTEKSESSTQNENKSLRKKIHEGELRNFTNKEIPKGEFLKKIEQIKGQEVWRKDHPSWKKIMEAFDNIKYLEESHNEIFEECLRQKRFDKSCFKNESGNLVKKTQTL